jgi:hypothetical protein
MKPISERRILALSLDWQGFGFAVLDGSNDPIDFGTRNFRRKIKIPLEAKILLLLDANQPDALVMATPTTAVRKKIAAKIAKVAKAEKIPLVFVSGPDIRKAFAPMGRSKYQIARAIAERYPELQFRLPSPRKSYQSEKFINFCQFLDLGKCGLTRPVFPFGYSTRRDFLPGIGPIAFQHFNVWSEPCPSSPFQNKRLKCGILHV